MKSPPTLLTNSSVPLREGDAVRSTNRLYAEYGVGRIRRIKNDIARVEYSPSVFMTPPYQCHTKVHPLAELEKVDTPLDRAARSQWDSAWRFELKMLAARLLTGNKGGQLSNARTEILPHQIFTAHRVVSSPRRRFLLADEVGLGKTIEAGMIWQALHQRGQAKRTLIITPAGLTTQWQEEMQDKFGATFEIFGRDFNSVNPRIWEYRAQAIASLDRLKRKEHKRLLLENRKWDLIIFDEAHRLSAVNYGSGKTEKTQNYKLAEDIGLPEYSEAFLLLTATPHQGEDNHSRFKNLVRLLDDNIDFSALEEDFPLLPGAGGGTKFTELVIRTPKKDVTDAQGRKVFKGRQTHRLPAKMYADEEAFYLAVTEYIRNGYKALERIGESAQQRAAGFLLTTFQKLNASSTAAIQAALRGRLMRLRGELCGVNLEEDEEQQDERYLGEIEEEEVLKNEREIMEEEVAALEQLLAMPITRDKKLTELLGLIDHIAQESARGDQEKVLIFTEYRQTQRHLVAELEAKYGKGCAVVIHGGMKLERLEENQRDIEELWAPFAKAGAVDTPHDQTDEPAPVPGPTESPLPGLDRGGRRRHQFAVLPRVHQLRPALEPDAGRAARRPHLSVWSGQSRAGLSPVQQGDGRGPRPGIFRRPNRRCGEGDRQGDRREPGGDSGQPQRAARKRNRPQGDLQAGAGRRQPQQADAEGDRRSGEAGQARL
jgi:hypothetical protein